jgi:membrane protein
MDIKARLDDLGRRWPWLGFLLAVNDRFNEIGGGPVAGSITLTTFLSLFPLLLVGIAVVGFLSVSRADFIDTMVTELGLTDEAAELFTTAIGTAAESRRAATIIGLLGLLWSGLALVGALSHGLNRVWQVQGRGIKDRLFGLVWLIAALVLLLSGFAVSGVLRVLPGPGWVLTLVAGGLIHALLFWLMFRVIGNAPVSWKRLLPGAIVAGLGYEVLALASGIIVPRLISSSSALYGSIGVVFAILAWLFFFGRLIIYAAVVNVVLFERSRGTVGIEVRVPRYRGLVPLRATRAGIIEEAVTGTNPTPRS